MDLVLIDSNPATRTEMVSRVADALQQSETQKIKLVEVDELGMAAVDWGNVAGCLIGPGSFQSLEEIISGVRMGFPSGPLGVVLDEASYSKHALILRKKLHCRIISLADLAQLADFVIECDFQLAGNTSAARNRGLIGVAQFKGGVGTTTLVAALASCWARHGLSVAAIDLDDLNPQLTAWARVGVSQRTVIAELLRQGEVPISRINELVYPVEGHEGRFVVVGQPEAYNESFHFKANVIEGAPSSADFMNSLIDNLRNEFDAVIIDLSRSWGIATFASLPLCQSVLLVTDDDGMSVRRTLDSLQRLKQESDDPDEFNFDKWSVILNGFTGRLISPKEIAAEIQDMELFPPDCNLYCVPFSDTGRQWGAPGQSFYDLADPRARQVIRRIAADLIPFEFDEQEDSLGLKIMKKWQALTNAR